MEMNRIPKAIAAMTILSMIFLCKAAAEIEGDGYMMEANCEMGYMQIFFQKIHLKHCRP